MGMLMNLIRKQKLIRIKLLVNQAIKMYGLFNPEKIQIEGME